LFSGWAQGKKEVQELYWEIVRGKFLENQALKRRKVGNLKVWRYMEFFF